MSAEHRRHHVCLLALITLSYFRLCNVTVEWYLHCKNTLPSVLVGHSKDSILIIQAALLRSLSKVFHQHDAFRVCEKQFQHNHNHRFTFP